MTPSGEEIQAILIVTQYSLFGTHVREGIREVPPLEHFFVDVVAVVPSDEGLCFPALLEEGMTGLCE
jgi:hypothetical protein